MALEAAVFSPDLLLPSNREWSYDLPTGAFPEEDHDNNPADLRQQDRLHVHRGAPRSSVPEAEPNRRKKRRRSARACRNKEQVESQRMTHIAIERNRRKQMNDYLAAVRSLMPPSYLQRGDQASIIGGAINYVKELEKLLHSLEAQKRQLVGDLRPPFADFFSLPRHHSAVADIEVSMIERHANVKVLTWRRPKQLLKLVVGLESLRLSALHLNVTALDHTILYSFSLKAEEDCRLNSEDEIATAVHRMLVGIQEESFDIC